MPTNAAEATSLHSPILLDDRLLEALPAAVYVCDLDGVVVRYNKKAAELWGRSPMPGDANELYCGSHRLYKPDGDLLPYDQMVDAMRLGCSFSNMEVQVEQPNGRRLWVLVNIDPLRDESGAIVGAINCFSDITDHKLEQERRVRLSELNHRVGNTLAVVQIANQTFKGVEGTDAPQIFQDRLIALARAHTVLGREEWVGATLGDIVSNVVVPLCGDQLTVSGPDVKLDPRLTITLALAFQELSTNSHKYGALSNPNGKVQLDWAVTGEPSDPNLRLSWIEDAGFDLKEPTRRGLGSSFIETMLTRAHKASVTLSFPPTGARCEILLPIGDA